MPAQCAVNNSAISAADDAAPWLTIILVGHIFLPLRLHGQCGLDADLGRHAECGRPVSR